MDEKTEVFCNSCFGQKNHDILYSDRKKYEDDAGDITYDMLKCCGCGNITLRQQTRNYFDINEDFNPIVHSSFYPPRIDRRQPEWFPDIFQSDRYIVFLLKEIYLAKYNKCGRLAGMGIRTLLDHIFIAHGAAPNDPFPIKLNKFHEAGHITKNQIRTLTNVLEAGHAATHRNFNPSNEDLNTCLNIIENIIENLYIHQKQAEKLKKKIPDRPKKDKTK